MSVILEWRKTGIRGMCHGAHAGPSTRVVNNEFCGGEICVRTAHTEWRDRQNDEIWPCRRQCGGVQTKIYRLGRLQGQHQDICPGDQRIELLALFNQIDRNTALVCIQRKEESAVFRMRLVLGERTSCTGWITFRGFYFNDVSTFVGQQPRGPAAPIPAPISTTLGWFISRGLQDHHQRVETRWFAFSQMDVQFFRTSATRYSRRD